ncbi:MAG: protein translocase subunit SecD, partial [Proteobacteria bacterium]|nr:protein translocase subunit SecD [Pseudomonadota bacterium]
PGLQDASRAQQILGGTATVELHLADVENDARTAQSSGIIPVGTKLYEANGRPVLLKNDVILTGDSITNAMMSYDETGMPAVNISLGGGGSSLFTDATRKNIGKPMGIVYVETKTEPKKAGDKSPPVSHKVEKVIMVATIQDVLVSNFRITGISDQQEAANLALLLRAGALPATIYPVESRLIGPTLGKENIQRGTTSLVVGLLIIMAIMLVYYRLFGLIANIGLILNLILLVAVLSLIGAVLTLPGIAGMVLTIAMAVDADVLIYERIREERRHGLSIQAAIYAGYERAFATIVDANLTTLIVAIILFAIGAGAVKGFAVTLMIGLMTSMITGIAYTRAIVNAIYGGRSVERLSIGA